MMGVDKQAVDLDEKRMRDSFSSNSKLGGGETQTEASALGAVLSDSHAQLLAWNALQFERMLDDGTLGKCYRVQLRADDVSPDAGRKVVLRRLGVDVLNSVSKLEWAERIGEFQVLSEHPSLLRTIGLASDGANNFGLLLESAPTSLDRILVRAEASEEVATKLRFGWPQLARESALTGFKPSPLVPYGPLFHSHPKSTMCMAPASDGAHARNPFRQLRAGWRRCTPSTSRTWRCTRAT
jgi:hypothetical protein